MNHAWQKIWADKGTNFAIGDTEDETLERLLKLNGYFTKTATLTLAAWRSYVADLAEKLGILPTDRLFEVGCGSGAFLYPLRQLGCTTDGLDYSASLVEAARLVLPGGHFVAGEASALEPNPTYDFVLASGVFLYFPSLAYAEAVLERMVAKATRGVAILDISDAACEEEATCLRRASYAPGEYDRQYAGLEHLYLERAWFEQFARRHGLICRVESQFLPGYLNARYRFNAYLFKGDTAPA